MSSSNNAHASSVTSATSSSNNHHHHLPSNAHRSSSSGGGAGGGGGCGGGGRSSSSGGGGGASSGSTRTTTTTTTPSPACAACKYQRRKCNPDCTLAPYFPADHQRQFLNAHRLFGVSNILKTLRGLDPSQHAAAMSSIIFQSNARAQDPIGGCYRIILDLERQIDRDSAELDLVLRQLALCRAQAQQPPPPPPLPELNIASTINLIDQNDDPNPADDVAGIPTLQQQQEAQQQQQQQYLYYYFGGSEGGGETIKDHSAGLQPTPPSPLLSSGGIAQPYQRQPCEDDDVKPPPVDLFDVRHHQTFLAVGDEGDDSKDASPDLDYSGMARLEMKDEPNSIEQVQEHDLKGAASLFKLTNYGMSGV